MQGHSVTLRLTQGDMQGHLCVITNPDRKVTDTDREVTPCCPLVALFWLAFNFMQGKIWTIGHSTRPLEEFIGMLKSFEIQMVADIRAFPGSRKYPQFNKDSLAQSLKQAGIEYIHMPELGGRRRPRPDSSHTEWRNDAFRAYADYMDTPAFKEAADRLQALAREKRLAYMCSEAVWWRCHRALVSDYLKLAGWKVEHIMGEGKSQEHPFTTPVRQAQQQ